MKKFFKTTAFIFALSLVSAIGVNSKNAYAACSHDVWTGDVEKRVIEKYTCDCMGKNKCKLVSYGKFHVLRCKECSKLIQEKLLDSWNVHEMDMNFH